MTTRLLRCLCPCWAPTTVKQSKKWAPRSTSWWITRNCQCWRLKKKISSDRYFVYYIYLVSIFFNNIFYFDIKKENLKPLLLQNSNFHLNTFMLLLKCQKCFTKLTLKKVKKHSKFLQFIWHKVCILKLVHAWILIFIIAWNSNKKKKLNVIA